MRPAAALPLGALHQAELDPGLLRFSSAGSMFLGNNKFTTGLQASRSIKIKIFLFEGLSSLHRRRARQTPRQLMGLGPPHQHLRGPV